MVRLCIKKGYDYDRLVKRYGKDMFRKLYDQDKYMERYDYKMFTKW